jgi:hypothetical protein
VSERVRRPAECSPDSPRQASYRDGVLVLAGRYRHFGSPVILLVPNFRCTYRSHTRAGFPSTQIITGYQANQRCHSDCAWAFEAAILMPAVRSAGRLRGAPWDRPALGNRARGGGPASVIIEQVSRRAPAPR